MNIKVWKFFIPIYGIFYMFKVGNTIGWRTPLPISGVVAISIPIWQAICCILSLLLLI